MCQLFDFETLDIQSFGFCLLADVFVGVLVIFWNIAVGLLYKEL